MVYVPEYREYWWAAHKILGAILHCLLMPYRVEAQEFHFEPEFIGHQGYRLCIEAHVYRHHEPHVHTRFYDIGGGDLHEPCEFID